MIQNQMVQEAIYIDTLLGRESLPGGNRAEFSQEAHSSLEKAGFRIFDLTGMSIEEIMEKGRTAIAWKEDHSYFLRSRSRRSQIAVNLSMPFIEDSRRKTYAEQLKIASRLTDALSSRIEGTKVIIGNAADYAEFDLAYRREIGNDFFGKNTNYQYASTSSILGLFEIVTVGRGYYGHDELRFVKHQ